MKTILIKIGSGTLLTQRGKLDLFRIAHIADQVSHIREKGEHVILVLSGAVACGADCLELSNDISRMAAAGVGQIYLMSAFQKAFGVKKITVAQVLISTGNIDSIARRDSIRRMLGMCAQAGIVALINENDAVELNGFGGNDLLAVEIANLIEAKQVLILSTMTGSTHGVGGGVTKLYAVKQLEKSGIRATIVNGKDQNVITEHIV
jgi:glutamate 5-kinase